MAKKLPREILVYKCDELDDGTPVYAVATKVVEIPVDMDNEQVGVYILNKLYRFSMKQELK